MGSEEIFIFTKFPQYKIKIILYLYTVQHQHSTPYTCIDRINVKTAQPGPNFMDVYGCSEFKKLSKYFLICQNPQKKYR